MIVTFFIVFILSLAGEKKIILKELQNDPDLSLLAPDHLGIISTQKRNRKGWISEDIRRKYSGLVVKYAFRKHQFRNSSGISKENYRNDVELLRIKLLEIINKATLENKEID